MAGAGAVGGRADAAEVHMAVTEKNAVVTGGASGIGRAVALRLARDGVNVAVFDLNLADAQEAARAIVALGRRALAAEVDVTRATSVQAGVDRVHAELGPVHILVNNAGIGEMIALTEMSEAQWDRMIAVHLKGTFLCTRAIVDDMLAAGWGRIVNMASTAGLSGAPRFTHYAAAKAGMIGFTKSLAQEIGPQGVTVNAIAPGLVDTPILPRSGFPPAYVKASAERAPMRRIGTPDDIAAACAYIVSDEAGFFTGQVLAPNGGVYS